MLMEYYRPYTTGVIVSLEALSTGLLDRGHAVHWVLPNGCDEPRPRVSAQRVPRLPRISRLPSSTLAPSFRLAGAIRGLRPDIIHVHHPFVAFLAGRMASKRFGVPLVLTAHTMLPAYAHFSPIRPPGTAAVLGFWLRWVCCQADVVLAPSHRAANYLQSLGVRTLIEVVPTGVDVSQFHSEMASGRGASIRRRLGLSPRDFVVGYVGRVSAEKNVAMLLAAVRLTKSDAIKLLIMGDGGCRRGLERCAAQLNLTDRVVFTGVVDHRDLPNHIAACDCTAHYSASEFQGLAVLESLACGVPVVVPAGTAQAELIQDGKNGLVTDSDPGELANAIERLRAAPSFRAGLSVHALVTARGNDSDAFAAKVEAIYHRSIVRM